MQNTVTKTHNYIELFFAKSNAWTSYASCMLKFAYKTKAMSIDDSATDRINKYLHPDSSNSKDIDSIIKSSAYRNGAFFLVALGVISFFLALIPYSVQLNEQIAHILGITEAILLSLTSILAIYLSKKKSEWCNSRREDEAQRYMQLNNLIEKYKACSESSESASQEKELKIEFDKIIEEQISYNYDRFAMYDAIEKSTISITITLFAITLAAAFLHILIHIEWLLLITAGAPMVAAALHALNSLTNLPVNHTDHKRIWKKLNNLLSLKEDNLLEKSLKLYSTLTENDDDWKHQTESTSTSQGI